MPRSSRHPAPATRIEQLAVVHPHAAALDIGAHEIVAAVPPDQDNQPIRAFGTFTVDLAQLADWFVACGITTVALESTRV
jgi:hypothetical protein